MSDPEFDELMKRPGVAERLAALEAAAKGRALFNPPDPVKYARAVVGYFLDPPAIGSVQMSCDHCGDDIIVGPQSQEILAKDKYARPLCCPCVLAVNAVARRQGLATLDVMHTSEYLERD